MYPRDLTEFDLVGPPSDFGGQSPDARTLGNNFIVASALSISKGVGWNILPWDPNYNTQS